MKINVLNNTLKGNQSQIYAQRERKEFIKRAAAYHVGRKDFNPRPAKYRSNRGLALKKGDQWATISLQLAPVALLITYLILKNVI